MIPVIANTLADRRVHGDWYIGESAWYPATILDSRDLFAPFGLFGFARLHTRPHRVKLAWHVDYTNDESLRTVIDYLAGLEASRPVTLFFCKGGWAREAYAGPAQAIARITALGQFRDVEPTPQTTIRSLPLTELGGAAATLRNAFAAWRHSRNAWDWINTPVGQRGLIFERQEDRLTFAHVGAQSEIRRMLGRSWRDQAIGTACDDAFQDDRFNTRADAAYVTAETTGAPQYEHILAHLAFRGLDIWLPYQRLVCPMPDGVAVFTHITPAIKLQLLAHRA